LKPLRSSTVHGGEDVTEELLDDGIPKTHIREYINRYDFL
jgi:hypothetical protein